MFLQTLLGSNLKDRVSANRLVTNPNQVVPGDSKRDLIWVGDDLYSKSIQPRTFGANGSTSNSLEVNFHKKLERLYLTYDVNETPVVIYAKNSSTAKENLATPPAFIETHS